MQGNLFSRAALAKISAISELPLTLDQLRNWQKRIHDYQASLFQREQLIHSQSELFNYPRINPAEEINPLALTPIALNFWRWPKSFHQGPAIYLVMDRPAELEHPLMLYVGETMAADRRWKGAHDCKAYLAAYGEALQRCSCNHQLSIRFYSDVPSNTHARRSIEKKLIQLWLPPFNKETRQRWATPFTAKLE